MEAEGAVVVSRKGEARVQKGHPWIFRSDIERAKAVSPGAIVRVLASGGKPLGFAFWSATRSVTRSLRIC